MTDLDKAVETTTGPMAADLDGLERTIEGESVHGFKVAAWRYHDHHDNPDHGHRYCEHWSTPGQGAWGVERMFTETQLREALAARSLTRSSDGEG